MDRIRSGKVSSPAEACVPPDFGDEALHTSALYVFVAKALAVTDARPVNHIHVDCMTNKVIADFGGLYYGSLSSPSILPEGTGQVYLQQKGSRKINYLVLQ